MKKIHNNKQKDIKFLQILNGDFNSPYKYTFNEVKAAFSKTRYSSEIKKRAANL